VLGFAVSWRCGNIGEGITRRFAAEGANVVLTGRNKDKLEALAGTLNPDRAAVIPADVTREADVQALADEAAARFGGIDVLVFPQPLPGPACPGRPRDPDDIAGAVAFLASADARFITGVILPVDGGITAGSSQPRFR
jgi:NAD(P)-dependent dehydrogenase (short-subunit alcohol dehydrogenase family)